MIIDLCLASHIPDGIYLILASRIHGSERLPNLVRGTVGLCKGPTHCGELKKRQTALLGGYFDCQSIEATRAIPSDKSCLKPRATMGWQAPGW